MMFILDQYIELWVAYGKGKKEGEQLEITVQNYIRNIILYRT